MCRLFPPPIIMALNDSDIAYIAHLARLDISEAEVPEYVDKLTRIIGFVDQLAGLDTEGVAPMAHPLDMTQRLRPDEVTETNERDRLQRNAASVAEGYYLVPRVIE